MAPKKLWLSKTFWLATVVPVVAAFIPGVGAFAASHVTEVTLVWGLLNLVLRAVTKDAVTLVD